MSRYVLLSCVLVVLAAAPASADDKNVVVFPLSGALLKEPLMDAPDVLTKTLAREISGTVGPPVAEGADPTRKACVAEVP